MKRMHILLGAAALALLLVGLVAGITRAQEGGNPAVQGDASSRAIAATPLSTSFTYQGELRKSGAVFSSTCEMAFRLYEDAGGANLVGSPITHSVVVSNSLFTEVLDFGSGAFSGDARWLGIVVKCPGDAAYTNLGRQALTAAPYALALPGLRTQPNATSPNVIGGYAGNFISDTVVGGTIAGGGEAGGINRVAADYATVGGGYDNQATGVDATVGGGYANQASGNYAAVGGGVGNQATGAAATVGGGEQNQATDYYATVGGGYGNQVTNQSATVGGGIENQAPGWAATVGGGAWNTAAFVATVGGGRNNQATSEAATVAGGDGNQASGVGAFVGGGGYDGTTSAGNTASGGASTIGGGVGNQATNWYATVGGGDSNTAGGDHSTVGGGWNNQASGVGAFVGGGGFNGSTVSGNEASGTASTIGGGYSNVVTAAYGTIAGGYDSSVTARYAAVAGGQQNQAAGIGGFVGGGYANQASGERATVAGGYTNRASGVGAFVGGGGYDGVTEAGNTASGAASTVPGGEGNTAQGNYSFAAGRRAQANHQGAFVWGDSTDADFASERSDQFRVRANGGVRFDVNSGWWVNIYRQTAHATTVLIDTFVGAYLTSGGVWTNASDRNLKENFSPVDGAEVLARLTQMPISTWNYRAEDTAIRHIGPTAQDFYAAFGLGYNDTSISTVDADGVALAAAQGLYDLSQEQAVRIQELEARVAALEASVGSGPARSAAGIPSGAWIGLGLALVAAALVWTRRRGGVQ